MVIGFLIISMVFGAFSMLLTLLSGGSFLLALAMYSLTGFVSIFLCAGLAVLASRLRRRQSAWSESDTKSSPISA